MSFTGDAIEKVVIHKVVGALMAHGGGHIVYCTYES